MARSLGAAYFAADICDPYHNRVEAEAPSKAALLEFERLVKDRWQAFMWSMP